MANALSGGGRYRRNGDPASGAAKYPDNQEECHTCPIDLYCTHRLKRE